MKPTPHLSVEVLNIVESDEIDKITACIKEVLSKKLRKRGLVVAISGGVDSAVCAALCVEAIGKDKVLGLLLPETDSRPNSVELGKEMSEFLGIEYLVQDIAPILNTIGCYQWRDAAIRKIFPDYGEDWKNKITISAGDLGLFNHFNLVVQCPNGEVFEKRMELKEYLQIVAATNYKQRVRKTIEYFHADCLNYAVVGTPNRLEYDQGFFVKNGDGSADVKPIAHLYKTQVYALARYLNIPEAIAMALPTTDTYSMDQGQDEFYFKLPYQEMDLALWCHNNDVAATDLAGLLNVGEAQAELVYKDILSKRKATAYLHSKPSLVEPVLEIL